ncbi:MAG: hypothetical protein M3O02_08070 [Acidobacteriota bacterium]|nr:hypothetical protein [Acidobacteriota bacterium]
MQEWVAADPSRTIRRFTSHQEQEEAGLRYWRDQPLAEKVKAVAELAQYFAAIHKIDLDAQGPKRIAVRLQRPQG